MPKRAGVAVVVFAAMATGCATIMQGTTQDVGINSVPTGAAVLVDNVPMGGTPVVAHMSRKDNHVVSISMDGYEPVQLTVTRSVSGWVAGNIIFGGLIGLAVDAITGGMYKLTPEQVAANMNKKAISLQRADGLLCVAVVLHADPSWEKIGQMATR